MIPILRTLVCFTLGLATGPALADITVGVILGVTGPGASIGVPYRNAVLLLPKTLGGQTVRYVLLDDATDPTNAAKNARKLIAEEKIDVLFGSSSVPASTQIAQIAAETKTPHVSLSPIALPPEKLQWTFIIPQPVPLMMGAVVDHMKAQGTKTIGYIGFSDSWGDLVLRGVEQHAGPAGMTIVASERYARADTSVVGQVLKILLAKPDAVVIGGSGTGGALPHVALVERGYKGRIYHNHGTVNREFMKIGGKNVEGAIAPTGPMMVAEDLPDSNPIKRVAVDFVKRYETAYGEGSRNAFAGYAYDGYLLLEAAVRRALAKSPPGTAEFRDQLRDALESSKDIVGTHGVYSMSAKDHNGGLDARARVLVQVENGAWRLVK